MLARGRWCRATRSNIWARCPAAAASRLARTGPPSNCVCPGHKGCVRLFPSWAGQRRAAAWRLRAADRPAAPGAVALRAAAEPPLLLQRQLLLQVEREAMQLLLPVGAATQRGARRRRVRQSACLAARYAGHRDWGLLRICCTSAAAVGMLGWFVLTGCSCRAGQGCDQV